MKKILCFTFVVLFFSSCSKEESQSNDESDPKQQMRDFVIKISKYAKSIKSDFAIIPQNGIELISKNGTLNLDYLNAIDANGQEDLFYGYNNDNEITPQVTNTYLKSFLNESLNLNKTILVTDYCSAESKMLESYSKNAGSGFISFAANHRNLDNIPSFPHPIFNENNALVTSISQVKNFLYLINCEKYASKIDFINAVTATNYDLLIMDLFFNDNYEFTPAEILQLKQKANGGKRIVICYMSIGEAEEYRYYWNTNWSLNPPQWLDAENPDWKGNFKVKYWNNDWQTIIYGNDNSYLKKILAAGFDGVYLDIIDAFEFYE